MAVTNQQRVGKALELLREGLTPFVEREMKAKYSVKWQAEAIQCLREPNAAKRLEKGWDVASLLTVMWDRWNVVFRDQLSQAHRSLVSELRDVRNRWAHQNGFSTDDAYRAMDSVQRLLEAVSAVDQAREIEKQKQEVLRVRFEEQTRRETRKAAATAVEGAPSSGLRPWREIVTPHPDVASGSYQQAEFAADLAQVYRGSGSQEYRDPREFFRRTYLTEGLKHLLVGAVQRLSGTGGPPVVELQTNFGGGKTHSLLALWHLFSGARAAELVGAESVLQAADTEKLPSVSRAVLVGTDIAPASPQKKPDGTVVRTLWGELAWQLGKKKGYKKVQKADESGTSPGSALRELFEEFGPCLILIDEWVAYARQLYGKEDLPAGSFDAHFTFAQTLSESSKAAPGCLLVVSIPSSDIETGGEGGKRALERIKNAIGRVESPWRPASAEESFEIVRRRLFENIADPKLFTARDTVVREFSDMYRKNKSEFPRGVGEGTYEERMKAAYPIHPELFDQLYEEWSSLEKFQRTRGVLRLMASVIHELWHRQDGSALILPAMVPIDAGPVQFELTRYLEDHWVPVIEGDIDGPASLPRKAR